MSSNFNLLTLLSIDSTSTHHCPNLKLDFQELSINFLIREFVHSTIVFLRISPILPLVMLHLVHHLALFMRLNPMMKL